MTKRKTWPSYVLYFAACVAWIGFFLLTELHGGSLAKSNLLPISSVSPSAPAPSPSILQIPVTGQEIWHMYNAVEEDERELRNILVAVPVLVTFMLIFGPYMLGLFAAEKVRVAVDERIKEAENALKAATEASSSLTEKMELKIERERALLFARLAYLHWSLDDAELATHYAGRASQTADRALERAPGDSALRNFLQDINQSFAYYTAELWGPLMSGSDDMVEAARKSGVQMLNELAGCKSSEIDLEVLDSCLFVIWTFRNLISDSDKAAAVILYRNWALALESRKWKKLQRGNYDRYRPYYESFR